MNRAHLTLGLLMAASLPQAGCSPKQADISAMVKQLMPREVRIVDAFSGFASFDSDGPPDGIELMLQPVDSFGDPVKIAGSIVVELYKRVPASAEAKGHRLCRPWEIALRTRDDQRRYWNRVTGMYEIPLKLPADAPLDGDQFVLLVTYHTPLDSFMTDELVITKPLPTRTGMAKAAR